MYVLPEHQINIPLLFNKELITNLSQQLALIRVMETPLGEVIVA